MGSSKPSSAVNLNAGPLSPSRISWTHRVRSPFGSSHRMYCLVVRYPIGRMYAAEWYPELVRGLHNPEALEGHALHRADGQPHAPFLIARQLIDLKLGPFYLVHVAHCRGARSTRRGPALFAWVPSLLLARGLGAGGWTANLPQSAAHRRRTRRLSTRFSGHSTATTSVEVKSIFAGDRSGFDFLFKGVFSFLFCGARRTG